MVGLIARRYLFGKKSTNVINIISGISVFGIAIGTAALILILSVFNGFADLLGGMFNKLNADLQVTPNQGKTLSINQQQLAKIKEIKGVKQISPFIEEVALFEYGEVQEIGSIKGVNEDYNQVVDLDSVIVEGAFDLNKVSTNKVVLGFFMSNKLGIHLNNAFESLTIYMPQKKGKVFGAKEYSAYEARPTAIFSSGSESDQDKIFCSLEFASKMLGYKDKYSGLELRVDQSLDQQLIRNQLAEVLGADIVIKDQYEQDASLLRIMNIEKWVSYLIVSLTLLLVVFNLIGCLWMIVLDKKFDLIILKTMGMEDQKISRIIFYIGMMICTVGLGLGILIALILYVLQINFGLVGIPDGFLIQAYPIRLVFLDFIIVAITVYLLGLIASFIPALKASKLPVSTGLTV